MKLLDAYNEQPRYSLVDGELKRLIVHYMRDDAYARTIHQCLDNPLLTLLAQTTPEDWRQDNGLLFFCRQCYVPSDLYLWHKIVVLYHDPPVARHPGQFQTAELVSKDFFWPGLQSFVSSFVQGCPQCQWMKVNTYPTWPPLQPIVPHYRSHLFTFVTCDFIIELPESSRYSVLMVVVNHDSMKGVIVIPCIEQVDATQTATMYHQNVFRHFGL